MNPMASNNVTLIMQRRSILLISLIIFNIHNINYKSYYVTGNLLVFICAATQAASKYQIDINYIFHSSFYSGISRYNDDFRYRWKNLTLVKNQYFLLAEIEISYRSKRLKIRCAISYWYQLSIKSLYSNSNSKLMPRWWCKKFKIESQQK